MTIIITHNRSFQPYQKPRAMPRDYATPLNVVHVEKLDTRWSLRDYGLNRHTLKASLQAGVSVFIFSEYRLPWSSLDNMRRSTTKPTKWSVRPVKAQISLGSRPIWSESSLCAQCPGLNGQLRTQGFFMHYADSEDSEQTGRMPRLIWVFAGRTGHFVGFVVLRLIWDDTSLTCMPLIVGVNDLFSISVATWQNQQNGCASSKDSDQPEHLPRLMRVFAVRMKKAWVLSYTLSAQRRLWSDWADVQADLSLRWAHTHFVGFVMSWLICFSFICMHFRLESVQTI